MNHICRKPAQPYGAPQCFEAETETTGTHRVGSAKSPKRSGKKFLFPIAAIISVISLSGCADLDAQRRREVLRAIGKATSQTARDVKPIEVPRLGGTICTAIALGDGAYHYRCN